jgi:hypothetical protein
MKIGDSILYENEVYISSNFKFSKSDGGYVNQKEIYKIIDIKDEEIKIENLKISKSFWIKKTNSGIIAHYPQKRYIFHVQRFIEHDDRGETLEEELKVCEKCKLDKDNLLNCKCLEKVKDVKFIKDYLERYNTKIEKIYKIYGINRRFEINDKEGYQFAGIWIEEKII